MDKTYLTQFHKDLSEWGIVLTEEQDQQFLKYYELLVEWNSFMNLTAITDFDEVMKKHFLDSLSFIHYWKYISQKNQIDIASGHENSIEKDESEVIGSSYFDFSSAKFSMIDVGTGAGFPGLPLAILFPQAKITLMDSLNKRIKFLDEVISSLKLTNIITIHSRAEDLAKNAAHREAYDYAVSRAVANLSTLTEYCLPFVKVGGSFVSYKSERLSEELAVAGKAIAILGGAAGDQIDFQLPNSDIYRNLFIIKKTKSTPKKYPRKAGLPSKEPLG